MESKDRIFFWYDYTEGGEYYQYAFTKMEKKVDFKYAYRNWLSIKPVEKCLFSRRNGYSGKRIFGYSIRLRLFGKDLI